MDGFVFRRAGHHFEAPTLKVDARSRIAWTAFLLPGWIRGFHLSKRRPFCCPGLRQFTVPVIITGSLCSQREDHCPPDGFFCMSCLNILRPPGGSHRSGSPPGVEWRSSCILRVVSG
jgi:hypothetical protein